MTVDRVDADRVDYSEHNHAHAEEDFSSLFSPHDSEEKYRNRDLAPVRGHDVETLRDPVEFVGLDFLIVVEVVFMSTGALVNAYRRANAVYDGACLDKRET